MEQQHSVSRHAWQRIPLADPASRNKRGVLSQIDRRHAGESDLPKLNDIRIPKVGS